MAIILFLKFFHDVIPTLSFDSNFDIDFGAWYIFTNVTDFYYLLYIYYIDYSKFKFPIYIKLLKFLL